MSVSNTLQFALQRNLRRIHCTNRSDAPKVNSVRLKGVLVGIPMAFARREAIADHEQVQMLKRRAEAGEKRAGLASEVWHQPEDPVHVHPGNNLNGSLPKKGVLTGVPCIRSRGGPSTRPAFGNRSPRLTI